jgi:hypothetical protein
MVARAKRLGNPILNGGRQKDRHKLQRPAATVVKLLGHEGALPIHALAFAGHFMPAESAVVGFRADDENGVRSIELIEHPARPALRRRAVHILVKKRLDAIRAQTLGEREHSLTVFVGIVAVADEDELGRAPRPVFNLD